MKKVLFFALISLLALAVAASAAEKKMHFYLGAGVDMPTGDAGDAYKLGLQAQGGLGFAVSPKLEIVPNIGYHTWSPDKQGLTFDGGKLNIISFGGDVKYNLGTEGKKSNPFIYGGVGMANGKVTDITSGGTTFTFESSTKVYFGGGAGIEFMSSDAMSFFVKAGFTSISTEGSSTTYFPFTAGVKF